MRSAAYACLKLKSVINLLRRIARKLVYEPWMYFVVDASAADVVRLVAKGSLGRQALCG